MLSVLQQQKFMRTYFFYYRGNLDGIKGPQTVAAIKGYQRGQALTADGIWGPKTDAASKANARAVQTMLARKGIPCTADGIIGPATINALTNYQKSVGLATDGIMGRATYNRLFDVSSAPTGSSLPAGYVSAHFGLTEFRCGCGGRYCNGYNGTYPSAKLLGILEALRSHFGRPITITSGIRCQRYNDSLRGSIRNSAHISGRAADIYIPGITNTVAGRAEVKRLAYAYGAAYCYYGTANMGNAVHINI